MDTDLYVGANAPCVRLGDFLSAKNKNKKVLIKIVDEKQEPSIVLVGYSH